MAAGRLFSGRTSSITDNGSGFSLTLDGEGETLILMGSDSYGGGTSVLAGTLIVDSAAALPEGTNLTVGNVSLFAAPLVPAGSFGLSDAVVAPVPEPGTLALLAAGALALMFYRKRNGS